MSRSRFVRGSARFLVAMLLFAQGVLAFAGCNMPERAPAAAIAAEDPPCHQSSGEVTLCVAHCLAGDQSLDKPQSSIPEPAAAPVLVLQRASDLQYASAPVVWRFVPPAAAPPPRILFRPLRI